MFVYSSASPVSCFECSKLCFTNKIHLFLFLSIFLVELSCYWWRWISLFGQREDYAKNNTQIIDSGYLLTSPIMFWCFTEFLHSTSNSQLLRLFNEIWGRVIPSGIPDHYVIFITPNWQLRVFKITIRCCSSAYPFYHRSLPPNIVFQRNNDSACK